MKNPCFFGIFRRLTLNFARLNPFIRSVGLYEKINRSDECRAYDSRLIYLISGELSYTLGGEGGKSGKRERLGPGNMLYIPAGQSYALKTKYMRAVIIAFDPTDDYAEEETRLPSPSAEFDFGLAHTKALLPPFDRVLRIDDFEAERDGFIRMNNIFTSAEGHYLAEISASLKAVLLKAASVTDENALPSSMVENLDGYIRDNVHDEISNTELGAIFGYHPFYISRMLKSKKGITLHQYVISYRMKCAVRALICSDRSVADIAEETGFTDASYFTKTFKNQFGMTPKEYRNKFKEDFI